VSWRGAQERRDPRSRRTSTGVSRRLYTVERLVAAAGQELEFRPRIAFRDVAGPRGRSVQVPGRLPRLEPDAALAEVQLPLTLNWSQPGQVFRLADRGDRARLYELVLREGGSEDILRLVDGVLLVDLWGELVLPKYVRAAWEPLIQNALDGSVHGLAS
jgi:hypothetical protein